MKNDVDCINSKLRKTAYNPSTYKNVISLPYPHFLAHLSVWVLCPLEFFGPLFSDLCRFRPRLVMVTHFYANLICLHMLKSV